MHFPVRVTSHIIDLVSRQFGPGQLGPGLLGPLQAIRIVINFDQVVKNNLKQKHLNLIFTISYYTGRVVLEVRNFLDRMSTGRVSFCVNFRKPRVGETGEKMEEVVVF